MLLPAKVLLLCTWRAPAGSLGLSENGPVRSYPLIQYHVSRCHCPPNAGLPLAVNALARPGRPRRVAGQPALSSSLSRPCREAGEFCG